MRYNFTNMDIRQLISERGIYYYQLAERLGIAPTTLSVRLRHELSQEQRQQIIDAIERC